MWTGSRSLRERLCELQLSYVHVPTEEAPQRALPHLDDPNTGWRGFGARAALQHLEETYREGEALGWAAGVPEPNVGDAERTSWLTRALAVLPER